MVLLAGLALFAQTSAKPASTIAIQKDCVVTLEYELTSKGKTVETTKGMAPFKAVSGSSLLPKALDSALIGRKAGDKGVTILKYGDLFGGCKMAKAIAGSDLVCAWSVRAVESKESRMVQIVDIAPGTGAVAQAGNTVEIHYTGKFPDGKKFDSSLDRNQTFSFKLGAGQVIKGFDMGVTGMKVGGKRTVTIPPEFGYGAKGAGGVIPPNATLVFDLELVSVKS